MPIFLYLICIIKLNKRQQKKYGNTIIKKIKLCESVGYKLIRIKEIDWLNDNINTKNFIKNLLDEVKV